MAAINNSDPSCLIVLIMMKSIAYGRKEKPDVTNRRAKLHNKSSNVIVFVIRPFLSIARLFTNVESTLTIHFGSSCSHLHTSSALSINIFQTQFFALVFS